MLNLTSEVIIAVTTRSLTYFILTHNTYNFIRRAIWQSSDKEYNTIMHNILSLRLTDFIGQFNRLSIPDVNGFIFNTAVRSEEIKQESSETQ